MATLASGAIGAACEVPPPTASRNAATAIAKTVRVIFILLVVSIGANLCQRITLKDDGGSTTELICNHERIVRILFDRLNVASERVAVDPGQMIAETEKLKQVALAGAAGAAARFTG